MQSDIFPLLFTVCEVQREISDTLYSIFNRESFEAFCETIRTGQKLIQ